MFNLYNCKNLYSILPRWRRRLHAWAHSYACCTQVIPSALNFWISSVCFSALTPVLALKLYVHTHSVSRLACFNLSQPTLAFSVMLTRCHIFLVFWVCSGDDPFNQSDSQISLMFLTSSTVYMIVSVDQHNHTQHCTNNMDIYLFPLLKSKLTPVMFSGCFGTRIPCRPHARRQLQKIHRNPALVCQRDDYDGDWWV